MKATWKWVLLVVLPVLLIAAALMIIVEQNRQDQAQQAARIYARQTQAAAQALLETQAAQQSSAAQQAAAATETALTALENQRATQQAVLRQEKDAALALRLAAQAELLRTKSPEMLDISALLAAESILRLPNGQADETIRYALKKMPRPVTTFSDAASTADYPYVWSVAISQDRNYLLVGGSDAAHLLSLPDGKELVRIPHPHPVKDVQFSPDGLHAASLSTAHLFLWRIDTGEVVAQVQQGGEIHDFAFSPDGSYLVTAGNDAATRIWQVDSHQLTEAGVIETDTDVLRLMFAPDGQTLLTITEGALIDGVMPEIWTYAVPSGQAIQKWQTGGGYPLAARFSPDGQYLAALDAQMVQVWDAASGQEVARLEEGRWEMAFSPNSQSLALSSADDTILWFFAEDSPRTVKIDQQKIGRVLFSPDGQYLAGISNEGGARVWRAMNGAEVAIIPHQGKVTDLAFSADSQYIASSSQDSTAAVWEIVPQPGRLAELVEAQPNMVDGAAFSPDGRFAAASSQQGHFALWTLDPLERQIFHEDIGGGVSKLIFSPNSAYVAYGGNFSLHLFDTQTLKEVGPIPYPEGEDHYLAAIAFSPDSRFLASVSHDDTARLWDVTTGQEVKQFGLERGGSGLDFTRDGKSLITADVTGAIQIWNLETGQATARFELLRSMYGPRVKASPDGAYLAVYDMDLVRIWDLTSQQQVFEYVDTSASPEIYAVDFSPDGRFFAASGNDGMVRVWDFHSGDEVFQLQNETAVREMFYSQDGKYIISHTEQITRIWDAATGKELARVPVYAVNAAFSPDSRLLATGAQVWFWQTADMLPLLCQGLTRNLTAEEWAQYLGSDPYHKTCPNLP